jgi:hypothetical protein
MLSSLPLVIQAALLDGQVFIFLLNSIMVWCTADVVDTLILKPDGKIAGDVGRAVVVEQPEAEKNGRQVDPRSFIQSQLHLRSLQSRR